VMGAVQMDSGGAGETVMEISFLGR
jgi:hypothetical protein